LFTCLFLGGELAMAVGRAKANVLHWVGFERWDAALLILLKRWLFVFHFSVRLLLVVSSFRVRHNSVYTQCFQFFNPSFYHNFKFCISKLSFR
jgi:hypothetical protein